MFDAGNTPYSITKSDQFRRVRAAIALRYLIGQFTSAGDDETVIFQIRPYDPETLDDRCKGNAVIVESDALASTAVEVTNEFGDVYVIALGTLANRLNVGRT